jgi:hypothetical protein
MSKWCPKCEWDGNDSYANFCELCGTQLIGQEYRDCPKCKTPYLFPSLVSHCSNCGTKLIVEAKEKTK